MNDYKNKMPVKAAAYMIMLMCFVIMAGSSLTVAINIAMNSYSSDVKTAYSYIQDRCASIASDAIVESIDINDLYDYVSVDDYEQPRLSKGISDVEIILDEAYKYDFGYALYGLEAGDSSMNEYSAKPVKKVNSEIINDYNKHRTRDGERILKISYFHDLYRADIYIGSVNNGQLPPTISDIAEKLVLMYNYRNIAIVTLAASSIIALILLIFLISVSGRKKDMPVLKRIPLDISAAAVIILSYIAAKYAVMFGDSNTDLMFTGFTASAVALAVIVTGWILLFAARVKQGRWWQSTLIYFLIHGFIRLLKPCGRQAAEIIKGLPFIWKIVVVYIAAAALNLIIVLSFDTYCSDFILILMLLLWIAGFILIGAFVFLTALRFRTIKEGAEHIAAGELDYQIDEKGMYSAMKAHAETLNNIREGLSSAVDEKMRSERLKTELITNVSHDIKTPLTSIINYIDFLKKEDLDSDKAAEYVDVLDRQSQRLKKLIEDLTEASKASTGNVKLHLAPCDAGVLMTQVMGEYQEKAEKEDLKLIMDIPESDEGVMIMADGRQLWRILNNLMNNICKYSMPGSRVYQSLKTEDGKAVITYRNISRYELNISADELTERFVRGDSSRHTEGSGLGLSIAQNLTELQGGTFDISIDGDLFKVTVKFDQI